MLVLQMLRLPLAELKVRLEHNKVIKGVRFSAKVRLGYPCDHWFGNVIAAIPNTQAEKFYFRMAWWCKLTSKAKPVNPEKFGLSKWMFPRPIKGKKVLAAHDICKHGLGRKLVQTAVHGELWIHLYINDYSMTTIPTEEIKYGFM